jgi:hypothetical protein
MHSIVRKQPYPLAALSRPRPVQGGIFRSVDSELIGVSYTEQAKLYTAVNSRGLEDATGFGAEAVASPAVLTEGERIRRWKTPWFSDVAFVDLDTHGPSR